MSFDFVNNQGVPVVPVGSFAPNFGVPQQASPQYSNTLPNGQQMNQVKPPVDPSIFETPKIKASGQKSFFSVIKEGSNEKAAVVPVDPVIPDTEKKRRGRPKKENNELVVKSTNNEVQKVSGTVEEYPTAYTYMETNNLLHETLGQIDSLNSELMQEFNSIRHNRTMKNKYNVLVGLSENVGSLINNRISVIKEINATITKSNDLDYKKEKDRRAANAALDDDKYIADLYKSFIQNPINIAPTPQMPQVDPAIFGSGIVRADLKSGDYNSNNPVDASYLNYMSNLTPEQNMMRYEGNGNVKQVVVFDAATGNKFFQMMDVSTGQVIPNVPVYDQMFMEDTTLDLKTKIAKNINLGETFPIVVINEGVTAQY